MPHILISEQKISLYCVFGGKFAPKRRGESILSSALPEQHCQHPSSRSPKLILLLSKSKPGSQSNYCPDCLLCSFQEPAQPFRADQGDKSRQEQPLLSNSIHPLTFQTWEFLISHLEKRKLERVYESTALGSDVPAAGMIAQGLVWDFPPRWFSFFSITALAKERFNRIVSKRKPGNGGKH